MVWGDVYYGPTAFFFFAACYLSPFSPQVAKVRDLIPHNKSGCPSEQRERWERWERVGEGDREWERESRAISSRKWPLVFQSIVGLVLALPSESSSPHK